MTYAGEIRFQLPGVEDSKVGLWDIPKFLSPNTQVGEKVAR